MKKTFAKWVPKLIIYEIKKIKNTKSRIVIARAHDFEKKQKWDKDYYSGEGNYFLWIMVYVFNVHGGRLGSNAL